MSKIRLTSPTFDASAKTIVHPSFSDVGLAGIQLITNVTDGVIIYNFADPTKGGTLATDTLTLEYDTTSMSDTDDLMILVEDGVQTTVVSATDLDIRPLVNTDVVTAELSATDNAVLDAIAASVAAIDADATTIIGHVDGLETSNAAIQAAVELIDNAIGVEDAAETAGGGLMMSGTVRRDTAASSAGTTGDNATLNTDSLGRLWISGAAVEDAAETAGGILLMAGSVRRDTAASSAGTTGDNATINTDSVGALWTRDTATQVDDAAFTPATGRIVPIGFLADETATDSVDEGDAGIARMTLDRKQIVANYAHAAGGATPYKLVSAATTNATSVKASAGTVYMITASNVNAAVRYLKLYNKASAPTVGTDVPVLTFAIPGNTAGAGTNIPVPTVGLNFSTGIAFALTTEATDAGTTAVAASEIVVNLGYV